MRTIKTALLSFGMSGKLFHAPFIDCHTGFQLAGAWERTKKNIGSIYPGTRSYSSLDELLADDTIEMVVVNTPTYTHYEYAKQALLSGKNLIVEKAFTTTVAEAEQLKSIAATAGKQIAVYHNRRWDSDFKTFQKIIKDGLLGDINEVEIHFDRYKTMLSPKEHKEAPGPGAGLLKDLGAHIIDQVLCLFGLPEAVFADIRITRQSSQVDDCIDILLYYPKHRVTLKSGYLVREPVPSFIAHGHKGSFLKTRADVQETDLLAGKKPGTKNWGIEPVEAKGLLHTEINGKLVCKKVTSLHGNYYEYYEGVYGALTTKDPMPVTVDDGINVMRVIEAAIKSSEEKCVVKL